MDKAVLELRSTGACDEKETDLTWKNALRRLVSKLEDDNTLWSRFGDPLSRFKRENPGYTARMLRGHLQTTATILFTKFGRTAKKGGKGGKGGKAGKSTFAACKPGVICFQYREQGSCDNKNC